MIYFLALLPATGLTVAGYFVLYLSNRSEGSMRTFGRYLGFWAFTLAALVILGAIFAAAHGGRRHMGWHGGFRGEMHHRWHGGPRFFGPPYGPPPPEAAPPEESAPGARPEPPRTSPQSGNSANPTNSAPGSAAPAPARPSQ